MVLWTSYLSLFSLSLLDLKGDPFLPQPRGFPPELEKFHHNCLLAPSFSCPLSIFFLEGAHPTPMTPPRLLLNHWQPLSRGGAIETSLSSHFAGGDHNPAGRKGVAQHSTRHHNHIVSRRPGWIWVEHTREMSA